MNTPTPSVFKRASLSLAIIAFLAGCAGTPIREERAARQQAAEVGRTYRPDNHQPALPALTAHSPAGDYLRFALLKHPQIEAAFHEWRAAVEAITPARSLPDPQLTFETDITNTLTTFMPGVMFDFMTRGKRAAIGREAAAASQVAYRAYVSAVIRTATDVRRAWVDLAYIEETMRFLRESATVFDQSLAISQANYTTGRGMATLEDQTRLLNEAAKLQTQLAIFDEQLTAARARFKSALGLRREDIDPPWPAQPFPTTALSNEETLWQRVIAANPGLGSMRAMVEMAVAAVDVARRTKTPDFTAGLMADLKADPLMVRPTATMTLPIWRDKIAAIIASADARRLAAEARLNAEQISLAAELAQMLFMIREADRMIAYIEGSGLPNTARALASAEAGYQSGMSGFGALSELRLMELDLKRERIAAHRQRETALVDLSLLVAGEVPAEGLLFSANLSK